MVVEEGHVAKKELGFVENFALGGIAAIVSKTVAAPIERVKLLIQNQDEMLKAGRLLNPYKGVIDCTMRTYHSEGVIPFWRGNLANCIRYFPTQALNFGFKDKINNMFQTKETDSYSAQFSKNIAAGGMAGGLSLVFVYSLDYARTRLANDTKEASKLAGSRQFNGLLDVYRKTLQSDGIVGLYRGFVISCVGIVIYRGIYFGLYDTLKPMMFGDDPGFLALFTLGYAVTILGELASYPVDTVRRRMMMTSGEAVKYKGSIDCCLQVVRNEGAMSLMKGAFANIIRGVSAAGVLVGFDEFKKFYIAWRLT